MRCFCCRWLVQFGAGSRDDIVCSKDGTRRKGEPSAEENLTCVVVFVLVRIWSPLPYELVALCHRSCSPLSWQHHYKATLRNVKKVEIQ